MTSHLPNLSTEIVQLITDTLESSDLFSLRLVCRAINQKTLYTFGRKCFTTLRTNLTTKSLQRLQHISKNDHLARHVETLRIVFDHFILRMTPNPSQWNTRRSEGRDSEANLLRNILANKFVNCRSFYIDTWNEVHRNRNHPHNSSDAVGILLTLGAGIDFQVKSLTAVDYQGPPSQIQPPPDTEGTTAMSHDRSQFEAAWSQIEELSLTSRYSINSLDEAQNLISCAPRARKLTLELRPMQHQLGPGISSSRLTSLQLSSAYVTIQSLPEIFIRNSDTLRTVTLSKVCTTNENTWSQIFNSLKGKCSLLDSFSAFKLKELSTTNMLEGSPFDDWSRILFSKLKNHPLVPNSECFRDTKRQLDNDERRMVELLKQPPVIMCPEENDNRERELYVHSNRRLIQQLDQPATIFYSEENYVLGASYTGKDMDNFLDILAKNVD